MEHPNTIEIWPPAVEHPAQEVAQVEKEDPGACALNMTLLGECVYLASLLIASLLWVFGLQRAGLLMMYVMPGLSFCIGITGFLSGLAQFRSNSGRLAAELAILFFVINACLNTAWHAANPM